MRLINFLREVIAWVLSGLIWVILILVCIACFLLSAVIGWILFGIVAFVMVYLFISELMDR